MARRNLNHSSMSMNSMDSEEMPAKKDEPHSMDLSADSLVRYEAISWIDWAQLTVPTFHRKPKSPPTSQKKLKRNPSRAKSSLRPKSHRRKYKKLNRHDSSHSNTTDKTHKNCWIDTKTTWAEKFRYVFVESMTISIYDVYVVLYEKGKWFISRRIMKVGNKHRVELKITILWNWDVAAWRRHTFFVQLLSAVSARLWRRLQFCGVLKLHDESIFFD